MKDQRTASAYVFDAICPALGLVLPFCNTEAMELHLQEIALAVQPGAHAVLFVDRAGWDITAKLKVPENMTLVPLPSKYPGLNPVENNWQYMRDNWLSNRIFKSHEDIVDYCGFNWNKLVARNWLTISIGMRECAHGSNFWGFGITTAATPFSASAIEVWSQTSICPARTPRPISFAVFSAKDRSRPAIITRSR